MIFLQANVEKSIVDSGFVTFVISFTPEKWFLKYDILWNLSCPHQLLAHHME